MPLTERCCRLRGTIDEGSVAMACPLLPAGAALGPVPGTCWAPAPAARGASGTPVARLCINIGSRAPNVMVGPTAMLGAAAAACGCLRRRASAEGACGAAPSAAAACGAPPCGLLGCRHARGCCCRLGTSAAAAPLAGSGQVPGAPAASAAAAAPEGRRRTGAGIGKCCGCTARIGALEVPVLAVGRSAWPPATAKAAPSAAWVLAVRLGGAARTPAAHPQAFILHSCAHNWCGASCTVERYWSQDSRARKTS